MTMHPCYFVVADRWPWAFHDDSDSTAERIIDSLRLPLPLLLPTSGAEDRTIVASAVVAVRTRIEITNVELVMAPDALFLRVKGHVPGPGPFISSVVDCKDEGLQAEIERATALTNPELPPARRILRGMIETAMRRTHREHRSTPLTSLARQTQRALSTDFELATSDSPSLLFAVLVRGYLSDDEQEGASR